MPGTYSEVSQALYALCTPFIPVLFIPRRNLPSRSLTIVVQAKETGLQDVNQEYSSKFEPKPHVVTHGNSATTVGPYNYADCVLCYYGGAIAL